MVFINIEQNELKQNIYNEKEVIKKEIKEELEKLKPEIGLKNIKKFKENITEIQNMFIEPEDMFISDRMKKEIKKQNKKLQQKQIKNDTESLFGGIKKVVSGNCNIF